MPDDAGACETKMDRPANPIKKESRFDRDDLTLFNVGSALVMVGYFATFIVLISLPLLLWAQYSGSFRWYLSLFLLSIIALLSAYFLYSMVRGPPAPTVYQEFSTKCRAPFSDLNGMMERAEDGMRYSQVMLDERVADAFLERARIAKGRSILESHAAAMSVERMSEFCGDRELAEFVVEARDAVGKPAGKAGGEGRKREGAKYVRKVNGLIDRIERWR
ncbi:MAG: hypothetical protein HZB92_03960 [Euryarchaeota archaeon]|nr:hypothetical protein [Euryarchaeota archaeon]